MKKFICLFLFVFAICPLLLITAKAHSGGTDSNGGHYNGDDYHYHHGYSAHDHYDMDGDGDIDCPYDFKDNVDHDREYPADNAISTPNASEVPGSSNEASKKKDIGSVISQILMVAALILCIAPYVLPFLWNVLVVIWNFLRHIGNRIKNLLSK